MREAVRRGAETIVVIRTVPSQLTYTPQWLKRVERWLSEGALQPLASRAPGSRIAALDKDYHLGRCCGRHFLATVGQWLQDQGTLVNQPPVVPAAPVANEPDCQGIAAAAEAGNDADYIKGSQA